LIITFELPCRILERNHPYILMSKHLRIPGHNLLALEAIADNARVDVATFIGQSIGLGLNLADLALEAPGASAAVLFEQPDKSYTQYAIDFRAAPRPVLAAEMVMFECEFGYKPPYDVLLPPQATAAIEVVGEHFGATRGSFLETAFFFRDQWTLTRRRNGMILIDDGGGDTPVIC